MKRTLITLLVGVAIGAAFSAVGAWAHGGRASSGFVDILPGQTARFVHTTTTCVTPKGQISGGQVSCSVSYVYWHNIFHPVAMKYDVGLTLLHCVDVSKWSRAGAHLRSARVC